MKYLQRQKIEAMHYRLGILPDKRCEDCSNLIKGYCGNTFVRKCTVYGATHSEASDWRKKYIACGMFNKEWSGNNIIDCVKSENAKRRDDLFPLEGQMTFEEGDT